MLLILSAGLMIGSALTLILRRNRESLLLAAICLSLTIYLVGIMLLISKQGGITRDVERFLYFTHSVRLWFQYRFLTFNQLGLIINVGRHLFPLFLLMMTERYTMVPVIRKRPALAARLSAVLPVLTMLLYIPQVYSELVSIIPGWRAIMFYMSYGWIIAYLLLSTVLLCYELFSITMPFFRRQFLMLVVCLVSLSVLYFIYCGQDPGQVYNFYSYDYLGIRGVGYMLLMPGLAGYIALVVINVAGGLLGIGMLLRYTEDTISNNRDDPGLERKFESTARLSDIHDTLVERSEELYRTVKSKSVTLVPVTLTEVGEVAADRFRKKYPEAPLELDLPAGVQVLADTNYLAEALYNLMTNGWEANLAAGHEDGPVSLIGYNVRLYTVLEVRDNGTGIEQAERKQIFEPFYSSKNTNFNWGMGLYHVRTIVRSHLGTLRVENRKGGGAAFFILLPRYDGRTRREGRRDK